MARAQWGSSAQSAGHVRPSCPCHLVGKKELLAQALEQEAIRDDALARDPWFDHAEAALQIGIVLTSVAILTSSIELMYVSLVIAIVGLLCTVNGFTLSIAAELP